MTQRVVLHVGTMKSGTTSLQALLFANRRVLAEQGVLVPGEAWRDQVAAVREVIRTGAADGQAWSALAEQVAAWRGTAVISMEYLGTFSERQVAAVVGSFPDRRVEVVVTARDLNRQLASLWQDPAQNGRAWGWEDYLRGAHRARPRPRRRDRHMTEAGRTFWRQQDLVRITRRWGAAVGDQAVTLVAVPPPGAPHSELTARFARVVGFDPAGLAPGPVSNASVGAASAQLLQQVNARLVELGIPTADGKPVRKELLAKRVLGGRARSEPKIGLPVARWVRTYAAGMVEQLRADGLRLAGEWTDLTPVDVPGTDPTKVAEAEVVAAARDGFEGLRGLLAERRPEPPDLPVWPAGRTVGQRDAVEALARLLEAALAPV